MKLGAERPWGETVCGYGLQGPVCGEPATVHVLWLHTRHTSTTCAEHLQVIVGQQDHPYELHTFGGDCGMPGTHWHHPYEDESEGYCLMPAPDDLSAMVVEPIAQEV